MIYGYTDESGAPGVVSYSKDCLLVSLIIFDATEDMENSIEVIEKLKESLRLPDGYEFHCGSNSTRPQAEFLKLLTSLKFRFITIVIHKNEFRKNCIVCAYS